MASRGCRGGRLARHALLHAGGRVTDELLDYRPRYGFDIEGGELQVKATDTRQLFDQLKGGLRPCRKGRHDARL
ncbi:MAG TPA: hypothetical protein PK867_07360 [Pirellulales bacterium]|nr:hypothetical protein [Pirellulales bacterium]